MKRLVLVPSSQGHQYPRDAFLALPAIRNLNFGALAGRSSTPLQASLVKLHYCYFALCGLISLTNSCFISEARHSGEGV